MAIMWRLFLRTETGQVAAGEFATKRELVKAMDARREPKTFVYRNGRDFNITVKK